MEDFGVRVEDREKATELDMRKLWNNFLIVVDFRLWETHGVQDGRGLIKRYIHDILDLEQDQEYLED